MFISILLPLSLSLSPLSNECKISFLQIVRSPHPTLYIFKPLKCYWISKVFFSLYRYLCKLVFRYFQILLGGKYDDYEFPISLYTENRQSWDKTSYHLCSFFTGINFTCFSFIYEDPCKFEKTAYDMVRSCD